MLTDQTNYQGNRYKCKSPTISTFSVPSKEIMHGVLWCFTTRFSGASKIAGRSGQKGSVTNMNILMFSQKICGETFQRPALARGHTQRTLSKEAP